MPMNGPSHLATSRELVLHPASPRLGVDSILVATVVDADGSLTLDYALAGRLEGLSIPGAGPVSPGERLWEHTCLEAFVRADGMPGYLEFNFSPSRQWAVYAFRRYREPDEPWTGLAPSIEVTRGDARLVLSIRVPQVVATLMRQTRRLRFALSAVIESSNGERGYWALRHPAGKPDFHHDEAFRQVMDVPTSGVLQ